MESKGGLRWGRASVMAWIPRWLSMFVYMLSTSRVAKKQGSGTNKLDIL